MDVRLDAGLARDRDVVLTLTIERHVTTLAPATWDRNLRRGARHGPPVWRQNELAPR